MNEKISEDTKQYLDNIQKFREYAMRMTIKVETTTKVNCINCQQPIDKRKREHVEVVRRKQLSESLCPRLCFHYQCWLDMAGEEYEIK